MTTKKMLRKLEAIRVLRAAGLTDADLVHGLRLSSTAELRRLVFQLEEVEKGVKELVLCRDASCTGHTYVASDTAHSAQTCAGEKDDDEEGRCQTRAHAAA